MKQFEYQILELVKNQLKRCIVLVLFPNRAMKVTGYVERIMLLCFCLLFAANLSAQIKYSVSGTIVLSEAKGDVYLAIADEETNNIPMEGIKKIVLKSAGKELTFNFTDIPKGTYTLKCFQDINGNGKLDKGMFGPKEPWFLSWNGKKRFPPRWDDINFELDKDKIFNIKLE